MTVKQSSILTFYSEKQKIWNSLTFIDFEVGFVDKKNSISDVYNGASQSGVHLLVSSTKDKLNKVISITFCS